jgi:hypothetical protein
MRTGLRIGRTQGKRAAVVSACLALGGIVSACGGGGNAAPTAANTPGPPTQTPDQHISGNLDPNRIFQILSSAGYSVHQESISSDQSGEPVLVLFLRDGIQPLTIAQFSTAKARAAAGYTAGSKLVIGDSPYTFWASNIVIHLGPRDERSMPSAPGTDLQTAAARLVTTIDPFIGPLVQRSVIQVALPTQASPEPTPSASPAPKSSPKATPKATPKASKKP